MDEVTCHLWSTVLRSKNSPHYWGRYRTCNTLSEHHDNAGTVDRSLRQQSQPSTAWGIQRAFNIPSLPHTKHSLDSLLNSVKWWCFGKHSTDNPVASRMQTAASKGRNVFSCSLAHHSHHWWQLQFLAALSRNVWDFFSSCYTASVHVVLFAWRS